MARHLLKRVGPNQQGGGEPGVPGSFRDGGMARVGHRRAAHRDGKWGRVNRVNGERVTLDTCTTPITQSGTDDGETGKDGQLQHSDTEPASTEREYNVVDLYTVRGDAETAQPFVHEVRLLGPNREVV